MAERSCVEVVPEGEFDISNITQLVRLLEAAEGADDVLINCTHLEYIDSTGLTGLFRD